MPKIKIEVEIPDYSVKFCLDMMKSVLCDHLGEANYGLSYCCKISKKDLNKVSDDLNRVARPYECRVLAKNVE